MKNKLDFNITLPIHFKNIKSKNFGYYYPKNRKGPKIEIDSTADLFQIIATLYHEWTHFIIDYVDKLAIINIEARKSKVDENSKCIGIHCKISVKKQEAFAKKIDKVVEPLIKDYLLK